MRSRNPSSPPRVQYPVYKDPSLSQLNPVITFAHSFFNINFNVIFPSNSSLLTYFLLRLRIKIHFALSVSSMCATGAWQCHHWRTVCIITFIAVQFSTVLCYFRCVLPKYSVQYLTLKHLQSKFFPPANYCKVIFKCKNCKIDSPYRLRRTVIFNSFINKIVHENWISIGGTTCHADGILTPCPSLSGQDCFTWGLLS